MEKALEELMDEVRLFWNALVQRGERLHAEEPITLGQRAVLEFLVNSGPATVPHIARRRRVSRQHIQVLVYSLLEEGWVEPTPNPAHKRSALIRLTPPGERLIRQMKRKETRALEEAAPDVGEARVRQAARTLRAVRAALEAGD